MNIDKKISKIKDILNNIHSTTIQHSNHTGEKSINKLYQDYIKEIMNLLIDIKKEFSFE